MYSALGLVRLINVVSTAFAVFLFCGKVVAQDRPNILWIVIEDASCHIGPYGETEIETPHLDALASEAVTFDAAFVTSPVCSPSRSAMITGMAQSTLGVQNHRSQMDSGKGKGSPSYIDSYRLPIKIVPELFREAGYHTSMNKGIDREGGLGKADYNFVWDQFEYDSAHWLDCPEEKPFFAQLQLRGGKARGKDSGNVDPESVTLPSYYPEDPVMKKDWAQYLNTWIKVDREVGVVVQQLKAAGRYENTVIFVIADHGVSHMRGKQFLYDEGVRVPLIVKYPQGQYAGSRRKDPVMQIDLAPTSLAMAEIDIPDFMQGKDFEAVDYEARDAVFSGRDRCDETVDILRSVRTERFKYIRNFMSYVPHAQPNQYKDAKEIVETMRALHAAGKLNELQDRIFNSRRPTEELYDLQNDPEETRNLANYPQFSDTLENLRERLYRNMEESRDLGLIPEPIAEDLGRRYESKYEILRQSENASMVRDLISVIEAGEKGDVAVLLDCLTDQNPSARYWAATWLGLNGAEESVDSLIAATEDTAPSVQVAAGLALSRLGRSEAGTSLLLETIKDGNWLAGLYAIRAVEWSGIRTPEVRAEVEAALESNPYEFTRRIARRLVGQFEEAN